MASERYARSLDAAVHVKPSPINPSTSFCKPVGFEKIATWQFGQDALELRRFLQPTKAMMNTQDPSGKRWNPVLMTCNQFLIERVFVIKSTSLPKRGQKLNFTSTSPCPLLISKIAKIRYCINCLQPDTRPSIEFDSSGICPACRFAETYDSIDWNKRQDELDEIIAYGKRNSNSGYECVIGVSGGKDSIRQVMFAKEQMGLNPLLVCLSPPPEHVSSRGARNLENIIGLGFDTIVVTPAPQLWKQMMREGFLRFGNYQKSTEMALYSSAPKVAAAYHIPIIFLGENPAITVGELGVDRREEVPKNEELPHPRGWTTISLSRKHFGSLLVLVSLFISRRDGTWRHQRLLPWLLHQRLRQETQCRIRDFEWHGNETRNTRGNWMYHGA